MSAPPVTAPTPPAGARPRAALRHRLAERGVDRTLLLVLPAALAVIALFCYPFLYGLQLSFQPTRGGALGAYRQFFSEPFSRKSIWATFSLAVPASLINVGVSVPISYRMRREFRGKRLLLALLVVPITLGTVLTAEGILEFYGPAGWFNRTLHLLGLTASPMHLTMNYTGVLLSLVISGFPFAYLLTHSYLSGIHPSLEKAAATLGAGWWQRFRHVTFPLLLPGLMTTFSLSFVMAFAVFPSAMMVGDPNGSTHVISIEAYQAALERFDYAQGSADAMIMTALMLVVLVAVTALRSRLYRGSTGGKG
ncbi:putative multiple sugar ABC transporter permease [Actinacidiphila reveromycinica]|uniref:Putative multiple sugar ABC transporter permease n=1 Tax=Actinacidiphila reveromycinica TaxID=659352 RepID=A0A7U3VSQ4_9ACTN|nr:sugar ABC transporter permease [Streptomyces sp. SN-593]BBB01945.1 putative multiple sugar ABC transporter permease [Streptomyces sp. SN-593]